MKQCLREAAATIPWLCVLEGRLKTSPGRLWYSKQAKNAVQWKQKPLYNIPRIHRLSYRERNWINLRKNSTSVTRNTWEIPSPETTECYESILGKATTPQPCHLLLGWPWAIAVIWPRVAIFFLCSVLEVIFSLTIYGAVQTCFTSRICIGCSAVECMWT